MGEAYGPNHKYVVMFLEELRVGQPTDGRDSEGLARLRKWLLDPTTDYGSAYRELLETALRCGRLGECELARATAIEACNAGYPDLRVYMHVIGSYAAMALVMIDQLRLPVIQHLGAGVSVSRAFREYFRSLDAML